MLTKTVDRHSPRLPCAYSCIRSIVIGTSYPISTFPGPAEVEALVIVKLPPSVFFNKISSCNH